MGLETEESPTITSPGERMRARMGQLEVAVPEAQGWVEKGEETHKDPSLMTPSATEIDAHFEQLLNELPTSRKPHLALRLPDADPSTEVHSSEADVELLETPSKQEVDNQFKELLEQSKHKPQLPLHLPEHDATSRMVDEGSCAESAAGEKLLEASPDEVEADFGALLQTTQPASPSGSERRSKPQLKLPSPSDDRDCIKYTRSPPDPLPTPTAEEIDAELDTRAPPRKPPSPLAMPEDVPAENLSEACSEAPLATLSAQEVDMDFQALLSSKKPQLAVRLEEREAPAQVANELVASPKQVDKDFDHLLLASTEKLQLLRNTSLPINATRPPPLALGESGGLPSTEESEASVTPLENLTREAVDAEFARVLSQEGGVPRPSPLARHLSHKLDYAARGTLPAVTFNLLVNDDDEEAAEPLEPVRLVEPTLSAVNSAFDSLLQSGPPTLLAPVSVQVPAGGDDDDNAPQHDPVVLLEPSGSEVDRAFDNLLREGPPTLSKQPTLRITPELASAETPDEADAAPPPHSVETARVEEPTAGEVDAQFDRLLREGESDGVEQQAGQQQAEPANRVADHQEPSLGSSRNMEESDEDDSDCENDATSGGVMDDMDPRWRNKKKHVFVLSHAGKPIFSRYGDENALAGFFASIQAMISFVQDNGDTLHSVRAGDHWMVFLVRGPLYLVAVAATGEPASVLAAQLDLFHKQLIAILTNAVERTFQRSAKFDMRQLLGGTGPVLRSLIHAFTWEPALLVGAVPPLPLQVQKRRQLVSAFQNLWAPGLQFAVMLAGTQVVAVVSPNRTSIHAQDLLLLSNFVRSSESFRLSESFSPVCLPHYNPAAFLYTYIGYLEPEVCLLLLTTAPESFHELAAARQTLETSLRAQGVMNAIKNVQERPLLQLESVPTVAGGGPVGHTPLWHFMYHRVALGQIVSSTFRVPLTQKHSQKRVLRMYQRVHALAHNETKSERHRVHFRAGPKHVMLLCIGQDFELYTTFDPLTDKASAVTICNRLSSWLSQHEATLFMSPYPM